MNYEELKQRIAAVIKSNGNQEITGSVLQTVLMAMVDSLGEVYPQTYTDEEKAQARANIDALSNHNGEITIEKLSLEVQAILNDVANKQNITDESLATIAKTIVGAINEVYKGGLKDASIGVGKLAQAVQDTLETVVTNQNDIAELQGLINTKVKIINEDTDLDTINEVGLYLLSGGHSYTNYPLSDGVSSGSAYPQNATLLIVSYRHTETERSQTLVATSNSFQFPMVRGRNNYGNGWGTWNNDMMYPLWQGVNDSVKKRDDNLETTSKEVVGAINELFNGGVKDKSIATSKIEDGAITEPKLDTDLTTKVNNNVKTVEQTLALNEIDTVLKNLKFRDTYGNFFADKVSYNSAFKEGAPNGSIFGTFCKDNTFGVECYANVCGNNFLYNKIGAGCSSNIFGNDCRANTIEGDCNNNTFGNRCKWNTLKGLCSNNVLGNGCEYNDLGVRAINVHLDSGVSYIELKSNASGQGKALQNIHVLSGVHGKSATERLVINIPDEYLNSSRELIIATKRTDGGPSTPEDIVMYYADEVVDKQNKQDTTLATTSKEVVGAINEIFNGGVKNKSIVSDKIADYSITMSKLNRAGSYVPDLGLSAMHNLDITLTGEGKTGSATLQSNGVTYDQINNIIYAIDSIIRSLGNGVTLIITEPVAGSSFGTEYVGTVTGVTNRSSTELSAIVKNLTDNKDYFVVVNLVNYEFITKISLTDQLPKIASLETDVTTLQGLINTKVKIINKDTDLNTLTEDGLYLLSARRKYANYPLSDNLVSSSWTNTDSPALLVVSHFGITVSQLVLSVSHSEDLPLARNRMYNGTLWIPWSKDSLYKTIWKGVNDSVKKQDLLSLTDTEINNIWDNN